MWHPSQWEGRGAKHSPSSDDDHSVETVTFMTTVAVGATITVMATMVTMNIMEITTAVNNLKTEYD